MNRSHRSRAHRQGNERETDRIEAFSDSIFAFAITVLILNITIPKHEPNNTVDLAVVLFDLWPSYFTYLFSFVMIGLYWSNHHYVFKLYTKTNHVFILLNLLFLLFIAFLPLPTFALSQYLLDPTNQKVAATFYASGLLLQAMTWSLIWLYASRARLVDRHLDSTFVHRLTRQYIGSVALYAVAVALCAVNVALGIALCVGLTLLYLLPPPAPVYSSDEGGEA